MTAKCFVNPLRMILLRMFHFPSVFIKVKNGGVIKAIDIKIRNRKTTKKR